MTWYSFVWLRFDASEGCSYLVSLTLDLRLQKARKVYCVRFTEDVEKVLVVEDDQSDAMIDLLIALTTWKFCTVYLKKEMKKVM